MAGQRRRCKKIQRMKLTETPCFIEEVTDVDQHHRIRLRPPELRDMVDRQQQAWDLAGEI
jgi:hypothetical protein